MPARVVSAIHAGATDAPSSGRLTSPVGCGERNAPHPTYYLIPTRGVLEETRALSSYDAESLSSGRLHHDPTIQAINRLRSQSFQACNPRGNIVGFNIDMHPTFVFDTLDLHNRFIWRCLQHAVVAATAWMIEICRTPQRCCPELGGLINIRCAAIDQNRTKTGIVHGSYFSE